MVKNWSKGTKPLVSEQANAAQNAFSGQSLLSLALKMGPDTEASRSFLLRVVQPGLSGLVTTPLPKGSGFSAQPSYTLAYRDCGLGAEGAVRAAKRTNYDGSDDILPGSVPARTPRISCLVKVQPAHIGPENVQA